MFSAKRAKLFMTAILMGALVPVLAQADEGGMSKMDSSNMSCQDMMDHSKPMMEKMSEGDMKMKAQKEVDSAKMAMDKGDMSNCKSHMHKAMDMMKDKSMK